MNLLRCKDTPTHRTSPFIFSELPLSEVILALAAVKHLTLDDGLEWKAVLYVAYLVKYAFHFQRGGEELAPFRVGWIAE
jgi:hypothetical protein